MVSSEIFIDFRKTEPTMEFFAYAVVSAVSYSLGVPFVPALLPAIGFSPLGPVAGTVASVAQSYVGNVAAGSAFAVVQSAAMTT